MGAIIDLVELLGAEVVQRAYSEQEENEEYYMDVAMRELEKYENDTGCL